jgi:Mu transposase, C-terminal domain
MSDNGYPLSVLAAKAGMCEKTARKYLRLGKLPSQLKSPRNWRTRPDPFADVWPEMEKQLEAAPELEAVTLFEDLERRYPGRFQPGQLRTLQRRLRVWRALYGPEREVYFPQLHEPGVQAQSDFTSMNSLDVVVAGQWFPHLLYHFVLVYSNWEYGELCSSESGQALRSGLQNALWQLGRVPGEHRTDNLGAATCRTSTGREFTEAYLELMRHYGMTPTRNHPGEAHQNGDVEQSHYRAKERVDQALLLRGSREFASRSAYEQFLSQLFATSNRRRQARLEEELAVMVPLPARRLPDYREQKVRVTRWSTVTVAHNTYSVPSRLSSYEVVARLFAERVEIHFAGQRVCEMERLRGSEGARIDYRHLIGPLLRKPGAFAHYRFRDQLFPSTVFRQAYDQLLFEAPAQASRRYLEMLAWAADHSESALETALRERLAAGQPLDLAVLVERAQQPPSPPFWQVEVRPPTLDVYDRLLEEVRP